jgi:hypothetical protein
MAHPTRELYSRLGGPGSGVPQIRRSCTRDCGGRPFPCRHARIHGFDLGSERPYDSVANSFDHKVYPFQNRSKALTDPGSRLKSCTTSSYEKNENTLYRKVPLGLRVFPNLTPSPEAAYLSSFERLERSRRLHLYIQSYVYRMALSIFTHIPGLHSNREGRPIGWS